MTTRVQALRSSTTGAIPAAGSRLPGELWSNFPDLQLGVIDAAKNAQRLIAVRYFSTAANYAVGDAVVQAGALYVCTSAVTAGAFNPAKWNKLATGGDTALYMPLAGGTFTGPIVAPVGSTIVGYLPLTGGTLSGALNLAADPTSNLQAATKAYVDTHALPPVTMAASAPNSPAIGALWWDTVGGQLYVWYNDGSSSQWVIAVTPAGVSLPVASTTVLGGVKIDGTTIQAAGDGTISTVLVPMGDNRLINGDMRIDQRWNGASGTASGYTVDRWGYAGSQVSKGNWQRVNSNAGGSALAGFSYALAFASTSTYTAVAADQFIFYQSIEADQISDFAWGTASAQPVTLSFWASSTKTGTFGGSVQNYAATRSYPFSFSLPTANTWTKITVTIPGDTAGTWVMAGNAGAASLIFDLGSGATGRGTAGAWAAGNLVGVTGTQSIVVTNAAAFWLTGVKLEIGSVATPFNRQSLAKSMADCQRYYQTITTYFSGNVTTGGTYYTIVNLPVLTRATPTVVFTNVGQASFPATPTLNGANASMIQEGRTASASAVGLFSSTATCSAEL